MFNVHIIKNFEFAKFHAGLRVEFLTSSERRVLFGRLNEIVKYTENY